MCTPAKRGRVDEVHSYCRIERKNDSNRYGERIVDAKMLYFRVTFLRTASIGQANAVVPFSPTFR